MKNQWTSRDQAELDALQKRKAAFETEARAPLNKLVADLGLHLGFEAPSLGPTPPYPVRVVDVLIGRADALRDALEPFDSGIRCRGAG